MIVTHNGDVRKIPIDRKNMMKKIKSDTITIKSTMLKSSFAQSDRWFAKKIMYVTVI